MPQKTQKLRVRWSKKENDILISYPRSCDGHLAAYVFTSERQRRDHTQPGSPTVWDPSFVDELKARGYDITTLRFSVERKVP